MSRFSIAQLEQFRHKSHCSACVHHQRCQLWFSLLRADGELSAAGQTPFVPDITKPCNMFFPWADAFNLQGVKSKVLEGALDALTSSVYLTDCQGRIVYMNRAAKRQVKTGNALHVVNNHLTPVDTLARVKLTEAIAKAAVDEAERLSGGITVALPTAGNKGLVATVIPIESRGLNDLCDTAAAMVAIFVQDPTAVPPLAGDAFATLYGLTNSELRVLLAMTPGLSVKAVARILEISDKTAKTHLKRIYAKTGTSKQTELMHLLMASTPPVLN